MHEEESDMSSILEKTELPITQVEQDKYIQPNFCVLKAELGWKEAAKQSLVHYFPHYQYKQHGNL